ncbi:MAG: 50S ribosomal protein L13 [Bacteroides sp.]|nr:MAG: 50S ribosomal protein L13 [Bacteroides sp.]
MNINNNFNKMNNCTISVKKDQINRKWFVIDASDKILGRLASKIVVLIRGKCKTYYTPNVNCGDYIIVINSDKIKLSGKKMYNKEYIRYTGYPGGQRIEKAIDIIKKCSNNIIYKAVKRMLPKNKLSKNIIKNLYVYSKDEHPHLAQKPVKIL